MTGGYRVDLDRLADIVDQTSRFEQHLDNALEDVDARVDRLHTTWTGDVAIVHEKAHDEWKRGLADMRAALAVMRSNAATAHGNYGNAVTANASMWEQTR